MAAKSELVRSAFPMTREEIEELIYGKPEQQHRFTQDFPILPDVWIAYAELPTKRREAIKQNKTSPSERIELLLTPHKRRDAASLARALRRRWEDEWDNEKGQIARYRAKHPPKDLDFNKTPRILFNEAVVFADFTLEELLRVAMPLTDWWKNNVAKPLAGWRKAMDISASPAAPWTREDIQRFVQELQQAKTAIQGAETKSKLGGDPRLLKKLIIIIGAIERDRHEPQDTLTPAQDESFFSEDQSIPPELVSPFLDLLEGLTTPAESRGLLYGISQNRPANTSIWRSRLAIKADAAARVFEVDTSGICWAVLDAGIDARHEAFARRKKGAIVKEELDENGMEQFASRVVRTYDFLRIKDLLNPNTPIRTDGTYAEKLDPAEREHCKTELKHNLDNDKAIDWDLIEPFLRIPHVDRFYDQYQAKVKDGHGTHVAGIIAANWPEAPDHTSLENGLFGICQDLEIYDLRVLGFDDQRKPADEFTIIAALQFIRHLNAHRDLMAIHGVNLSMAVTHDVANYACGRTPICEECQRVVANGVVVVTAAGNRGFNKLANPCDGVMGDYRYISITDPGNAENVITVGSTHRYKPHNYGVSYFSSRGPTGDGRTKPDLVAPGERIDSCTPGNNFETMDGTSMAAPHVSGAAALLIARHRELIGQPERVKEILTKSATDLGREPRFQGAGMLDVLRALQSV
jgi:subtilisin family serine protease